MAVRYVSSFFELPSVGEHSVEAGGELYQLSRHWEELGSGHEVTQPRAHPKEMGCVEQRQTPRPCSPPPAAVCRNADGNVFQAGTLQTLTQGAGSTNPQTNSYQLRKSEQRGCCHSFGPTTTAVPGTSASLTSNPSLPSASVQG